VFELLTKCLYDKKHYPQYSVIDAYQKRLLSNTEIIEVCDFGAGSKVFRSNYRKVADIAKNAGISSKRAKMLFRICSYFDIQKVLEIGTSVGLATSAMAFARTNASITSAEGCNETAKVARAALEFAPNVLVVTTEFSEFLNSENIQNAKFDLVYFDGNHQKEATLQYFQTLLPTVSNDTLWIFDDIHWSAGMEKAWAEIKQHPQVTVTVDTFQWGLVFFRKEQQKEDFVVRV
jgi:predicted O-methyltransferase YrrM